MSSMSPEGREREDTNAFSVVLWGLKHFIWLLVIGGVAGAVLVPWYQHRQPRQYDATALVVAAELQAGITVLPRYGTSIFDNGAVAEAVSRKSDTGGDPEDVVPTEASLIAAQDSIVMEVQGHSADPKAAVDLANLAAETFVDELNAAGSGVGVFKLQSRASTPVAVDGGLRAALSSVIVGTLGGLILSAGLVLVYLVLRRPIVAGPRMLGGLPVAGVVVVPRSGRGSSAGGVTTVARNILRRSPDLIYILGTKQGDDRTQTVARALRASLGQARMKGPRSRRTGGEALFSPQVIELDTPDSPELLEMGAATLVLVVAREGTSSSALHRVTGPFDASQAALILVRSSSRRQPQHDDVPVIPPSAPAMKSTPPGLAKAKPTD